VTAKWTTQGIRPYPHRRGPDRGCGGDYDPSVATGRVRDDDEKRVGTWRGDLGVGRVEHVIGSIAAALMGCDEERWSDYGV
jgi:hypothetical protein